jgi:hypothetical protein
LWGALELKYLCVKTASDEKHVPKVGSMSQFPLRLEERSQVVREAFPEPQTSTSAVASEHEPKTHHPAMERGYRSWQVSSLYTKSLPHNLERATFVMAQERVEYAICAQGPGCHSNMSLGALI